MEEMEEMEMEMESMGRGWAEGGRDAHYLRHISTLSSGSLEPG